MAQLGTKYKSNYSYKDVERWSRRVHGNDIFQMDKLFFPINIDNTHWTVAVVDMTNKRIEYYDSYHLPGKKYVDALFDYLQDEHQTKKGTPLPNKEEWKLIYCISDSPYQTNNYDCGVFVCLLCDFLSSGSPLTYAEIHMGQWREFIVLALLDFHEKQKQQNADMSTLPNSSSDNGGAGSTETNVASIAEIGKAQNNRGPAISSRGRKITKKQTFDI